MGNSKKCGKKTVSAPNKCRKNAFAAYNMGLRLASSGVSFELRSKQSQEVEVEHVTASSSRALMVIADEPTPTSSHLHDSEVDSFNAAVESLMTDLISPEPGATSPTVGLVFESPPAPIVLQGRRIVDFDHYHNIIKMLNEHDKQFGCTISNMNIISEKFFGLSSTITYMCNMCNIKISVKTCDEQESANKMAVNDAAVAGIMGIGGGYHNLQEVMGALDIPCMSTNTYTKSHNTVCEGWKTAAEQSMQEAVKEEAAEARSRKEVDSSGIPLLTVVCDGCWSKRSYRKNYNALSGAAAIIGFYTKKVLYIGVKNKYCSVCVKAERQSVQVQNHVCFKNYEGNSTGMESAILVEGFKNSLSMYGVIFSKMIADGDSSTYKKILECRPYKNLTVEKIECRNHMLRNYFTKLSEIKAKTEFPISQRKSLTANALRLRVAITKAVQYRKQENVSFDVKTENLRKDIDNTVYHIFGEHTNCAGYFCDRKLKSGEVNYIPQFRQSGLLARITQFVQRLSRNARSLIYDVDSNAVEQFNSIIAKFVGGKRINYTQRRSYQGRVYAAVLQHNSHRAQYFVHKSLCGVSPSSFKKRTELQKISSIGKKATRRQLKPNVKPRHIFKKADKDYGPSVQQPDLTDLQLGKEKAEFLKSIYLSLKEMKNIERSTLSQSGSAQWMELRRTRLTASNFGLVCRRRHASNSGPLVKSILNSSQINAPSMAYGKQHEAEALLQLGSELGVSIEKCGLFLDFEFPYLGATPDGLIGCDTIVELKCPSSAARMEPKDAVVQKKMKYLILDENTDTFLLKKNHQYYYQIQGQLRITGRQTCIFAVWTGSNYPLIKIIIGKDDNFWKTEMKDNLTKFYLNCILPEILDSRLSRNMTVRNAKWF